MGEDGLVQQYSYKRSGLPMFWPGLPKLFLLLLLLLSLLETLMKHVLSCLTDQVLLASVQDYVGMSYGLCLCTWSI